MNVKELKETIKDLPDQMMVYLQTDPEGNGVYRVYYADPDCILAEEGYMPEIYSAEWTAEDACMDEDEWEELLKKPRVLVIAP